MRNMKRRDLIKGLGVAGVAACTGVFAGPKLLSALTAEPSNFAGFSPDTDPWLQLPPILARIKPPVFPQRDFDVTKFGAVGDNKTDCTEAFQKAIAACHAAKGGRVIVPAGEFLTGAIHLKSNVNLHLNEHWWPWKGRTKCGWTAGQPSQEKDRNQLFTMAEKGTPVSERVFGEGHYLRPQFIQPYRCKNVLIEGVTLKNSPMWQVHPVLCTNVTVHKMTILSGSVNRESGPNTDGCDPESCKDVLIKDCDFSTGDDCFAIKAGRNADGRRVNVPSENIVIQDCRMKDGHGGVTVGSEISGGVRNVFAENCRMDSPRLDIAIRIKNNAMRGGLLENIFVRNIEVGQVAMAGISIDFYYEEGEAGKFRPVVRNVDIRKLTANKAQYALFLRGFKNAPIENVHVADCELNGVEKPDVIENVKDLVLRNVRINGKLV